MSEAFVVWPTVELRAGLVYNLSGMDDIIAAL